MKKYIILWITIFILLSALPGVCENNEKTTITGKSYAGLAGVQQLYVVVKQERSFIPLQDLLQLIDKVSNKFDQVGLKVEAGVISDDINRDPNIGELLIYLDAVHIDESQFFALLELSFSRKVQLEKSDAEIKAVVWQSKPIVGRIEKSKLEERMKASILRQVDNFLIDYIVTKEMMPAAETKTAEHINPKEKETRKAGSGEEKKKTFVASRNGRVFHKPKCSSAKRISPSNLIYFKGRQDAEESGRRPCRRCKP